MTAAAFALGTLFGIAAMLLFAMWLATKDAKPKAEPHQFSATSSGADDSAHEIKQIFKSLESGYG